MRFHQLLILTAACLTHRLVQTYRSECSAEVRVFNNQAHLCYQETALVLADTDAAALKVTSRSYGLQILNSCMMHGFSVSHVVLQL